jgi:hypothetical protein
MSITEEYIKETVEMALEAGYKACASGKSLKKAKKEAVMS